MKIHLSSLNIRWLLTVVMLGVIFLFTGIGHVYPKTPDCTLIENKPVKVEAWLSKRYEKQLAQLRKEFVAMGSTRVTLWVYPAENPSKIVAIGSCIPAYIARHILIKTLEYYGDVRGLVHQSFFSSNWIGLGTSVFSENSIQPISSDKLKQLMDDSLDTSQFQLLYRQLTIQEEKVRAFGLLLDNPKLMKGN
jgi:hypothetical protein